jgi:hypothetical protein
MKRKRENPLKKRVAELERQVKDLQARPPIVVAPTIIVPLRRDDDRDPPGVGIPWTPWKQGPYGPVYPTWATPQYLCTTSTSGGLAQSITFNPPATTQ